MMSKIVRYVTIFLFCVNCGLIFDNGQRQNTTTRSLFDAESPERNIPSFSPKSLQLFNTSEPQTSTAKIYPSWLKHSRLVENNVMGATQTGGCGAPGGLPLGSGPPYNFKPLRKLLQPAYDRAAEESLKVPPLVHFTWFYKNNGTLRPPEMKFYHMIALLAAYKKIKPYKILIWYDVMPAGEWWDYAVKHIPSLLMVYRETPTMIFNTEIKFPEHKSDVVRLEAILCLGGIYLDLDSVALNSFDALRNFTAVQGASYQYALANGVIIGTPNNRFHRLLYLSYFKYNSTDFFSNSILNGMKLARKYPDLIRVDYKYILRPNIGERMYLYKEGWLWDWTKQYCVHLYVRRNSGEYDYDSVNRTGTVIGEIFRHILYNAPVPAPGYRPGDLGSRPHDSRVLHPGTRPSLFDISLWHYKNCERFPAGIWNCTELRRTLADYVSFNIRGFS